MCCAKVEIPVQVIPVQPMAVVAKAEDWLRVTLIANDQEIVGRVTGQNYGYRSTGQHFWVVRSDAIGDERITFDGKSETG